MVTRKVRIFHGYVSSLEGTPSFILLSSPFDLLSGLEENASTVRDPTGCLGFLALLFWRKMLRPPTSWRYLKFMENFRWVVPVVPSLSQASRLPSWYTFAAMGAANAGFTPSKDFPPAGCREERRWWLGIEKSSRRCQWKSLLS